MSKRVELLGQDRRELLDVPNVARREGTHRGGDDGVVVSGLAPVQLRDELPERRLVEHPFLRQ